MAASTHCCSTCTDADGKSVRLEVVTVRHLPAKNLSVRSKRCPVCNVTYRTEERCIAMRAPAVRIAASAS